MTSLLETVVTVTNF